MPHISLTSKQIKFKAEASEDVVVLDLRKNLADAESVIGTPTVTSQGLTLGAVTINSETVTVGRSDVPAGQAVQFSCAGGTAGNDYIMTLVYSTSESRNDLEAYLRLRVV